MDELTHISRFLSYVLRHHPESIGVSVDSNGWVHLPTLVRKAREAEKKLNRSQIEQVIRQAGKQRFTLSADGTFIRAGYGHSIEVDLGLEPRHPPAQLFHGTADRNLASIRNSGLHSGNRNFVHLSATRKEAMTVGSRHGKPVVLIIRASDMYESGHPFYQSGSEPGIWLTDGVPAAFIRF